jgi:signal peptidase II
LPTKGKKAYLVIVLAIVAVDQASKWLVSRHIEPRIVVDVVRGFFRLCTVRNSGAVWGFFSGHDSRWVPLLITALAIVALLVVIFFFLRTPARCRFELASYAIILGGALGNIIDRLRLGYVVDFLDFYHRSWHFPTFNFADSCITIGVLLLAVSLWRDKCTPY